MKYYEQINHPKWQRKRLEIMNRDNFMCQKCQDTETMLNVHHKKYEVNKKIWEYPDSNFITLCKNCHEFSHTTILYALKNKTNIIEIPAPFIIHESSVFTYRNIVYTVADIEKQGLNILVICENYDEHAYKNKYGKDLLDF